MTTGRNEQSLKVIRDCMDPSRQPNGTSPGLLWLQQSSNLFLTSRYTKSLHILRTHAQLLHQLDDTPEDPYQLYLTLHLLVRTAQFQYLSGEPPHLLYETLAVAQVLLDHPASQHFEHFHRFYRRQVNHLHGTLAYLFGDLYHASDIANNAQLPAMTDAIEELTRFIATELSHWSLAEDYVSKLSSAVQMMQTYAVKGYDLFPLFASLSNYALQPGAVEQAVGYFLSGVAHSLRRQGLTNVSAVIASHPGRYMENLHHMLHYDVIQRQFLGDSESFQSLLTMITQVASPVILSPPPSTAWWTEAHRLRSLAIDALRRLTHACQSDSERCYVNIHHRGAGVRGLFLAAYQGLALVEQLRLPSPWTVTAKPVVAQATESVRAADGRPISIVFVCYSISRHSVGRLLAKLIRHVVMLRSTVTDRPMFDVFIITDKVHPAVASSAASPSPSPSPADEIFMDIASLFTDRPERWITLPAFDFTPTRFAAIFESIPAYDGSSFETSPRLFDIAVFSDLLMQASQCSWAYTLRLAHQQVLFWGHPQTTGMPHTMDYYITSDSFESHRDHSVRQAQFVEQLVRFDTLSFALYEAEPIASQLPDEKRPSLKDSTTGSVSSRAEFVRWLATHSTSLSSGDHSTDLLLAAHDDVGVSPRLYGSLQTLMKHHPLLDQVLYELLVADPQAIVVLMRGSRQQAHWFQRFQLRLYDYISTRHQQQQQQQQHLLMGRNASGTDSHLTAQEDLDRLLQRLRWIDALPHRQYSRVVCHFDVNLDPFIFGGGVTLCDGLAGHCPVVVDAPSSIGPAHDWLRSIGFVTAGRLQSTRRRVDDLIYGSTAVLAEYVRFFQRIAQ
eukprot:gene3094-2268_t